MDTSEVRSIVRANLDRLRDQLLIGDWFVNVSYPALEGDVVGRATVHAEYKRAEIELDPAKLEDEAEVLRVLRHELIHVFLWPMHAFAVHAHDISDGRSTDFLWTFMLERMVKAVEDLLDGHGVPLAAQEVEAAA